MNNPQENFENYVNQNFLLSTEMERGMQNLETICEKCGYKKDGFRFGSPIEKFLMDNPGAHEVLREWIAENHQDAFEEYAEPEEEEEFDHEAGY